MGGKHEAGENVFTGNLPIGGEFDDVEGFQALVFAEGHLRHSDGDADSR
jgi:hypothetical protein